MSYTRYEPVKIEFIIYEFLLMIEYVLINGAVARFELATLGHEPNKLTTTPHCIWVVCLAGLEPTTFKSVA